MTIRVTVWNEFRHEKQNPRVAQLYPRIEDPAAADLHKVGTLAKVHKTVKMPNGNVVVFLEGLQRVQITELITLRPFMKAHVEAQPDYTGPVDAELEALVRNAQELFRDVVSHSPQLSDDLRARLEDEVGDLFFVVVNIARYLSLDEVSPHVLLLFVVAHGFLFGPVVGQLVAFARHREPAGAGQVRVQPGEAVGTGEEPVPHGQATKLSRSGNHALVTGDSVVTSATATG